MKGEDVKGLGRGALRSLPKAFARGAGAEELDALRRAGGRWRAGMMAEAARGGEEAARWAIERSREGRGARSIRAWALWEGLGAANEAGARLAFMEELGLPRALAPGEEEGALEALSAAAAGSDEALAGLLDALGPAGGRERGSGAVHYAEMAARAGARRVALIARHPVHGPALGGRRRAWAIREALLRCSEQEALGVAQELFEGADEGVESATIRHHSLIELAAVFGKAEAMLWMLGALPPDRARELAKEALRNHKPGEGGLSPSAQAAFKRLGGWSMAREEAAALESAAGAGERSGAPRGGRI